MPSIEEKIDTLENKMKYIIELLEKQERRAKMGLLWKFSLFIIVFVIPTYLTYKMFSGIDLGSLTESIKEFKSMVP